MRPLDYGKFTVIWYTDGRRKLRPGFVQVNLDNPMIRGWARFNFGKTGLRRWKNGEFQGSFEGLL